MSQTTVLVGFAEAMSAPETVWSLVDAGFRVIAFGRKGRASALRSSRYVVSYDVHAPEADLQKAISDLQGLMDSLAAQSDGGEFVLFPLDDKALWLCDKVKLPLGWLSAGARGKCTDLALNKNLQVEAALNAGFNVPKSAFARTVSDLSKFADLQSFPIILKAAECAPIIQNRVVTSRTWICANRCELDRAVAQWGERVPLLAQQFIVGTGEGAFGLAARDGIRAWSGHRRLRMMNPAGSGSSACISQAVGDDIKKNTEILLSTVQWRGLFMIELLRDLSGKLWFVELNGRPWGSMALSRRQGLQYPAWQVSLALDPHSVAGLDSTSTPGMVCRNLGRELIHLLFVLRGAKSKVPAEQLSFLNTLWEIVRVRHGDTFYNWRRDDSKVFFADSYYTIHDNLFKARN